MQNNWLAGNCYNPIETENRIVELRNSFPTSIKLLEVYNPTLQIKIALKGHNAGTLALNKDIPTLGLVRRAYGNQTAEMWIEAQLIALGDNTEVKNKLNEEQCIELSKLILAYFYYLNLAELSFFFGKLRSGAYGKFYGSISQDCITTALRAYEKERMNEISEIEEKLQQQERIRKQEDMHKNAVTREEYLAMVARGEIKPIEEDRK